MCTHYMTTKDAAVLAAELNITTAEVAESVAAADVEVRDVTSALYNLVEQRFTRTYVTYEEYEELADEGTADLLVEVELLGDDHYRLAATQYYDRHGVFEMTITQPLDRALRTFAAALAADTRIEVGL